MKIGDLVRIKDLHGHGARMQALVGHPGVFISYAREVSDCAAMVLIFGKLWVIADFDLEVISENR